ncbi:MAG: HD domain-containing protein [Candidatus Omnitrophica bacterium]|nr:HD domain-containing protein [Candidatus Omnitrophota bacterium]
MEKQKNLRAIDDVKKKVKELAALREIGKEISASLNLKHVLSTIIDRALALLNASKGCIMLLDPNTEKMHIGVVRGLSKEDVKNFKAQTVKNISKAHFTPSSLSVPLKLKKTITGVINITNGTEGKGFARRHLETLKEFADQAAIAIDNASTHQQLRKVVLNTIKALAVSIDQRDHYTSCHSENVARYAVAIAREMNLSEELIEKIEHAAQLHDIGKIGVRDYILSKPGKLTSAEWKEIKSHTSKGAEILKPLEFLNGIIEVVKQHHERSDGKGYPDGRKEKNIHIGAKIMAIADSFDAMISERPYRPAMSRKTAINEIKRSSGIMYDPRVVEAFLRAVAKKAI